MEQEPPGGGESEDEEGGDVEEEEELMGLIEGGQFAQVSAQSHPSHTAPPAAFPAGTDTVGMQGTGIEGMRQGTEGRRDAETHRPATHGAHVRARQGGHMGHMGHEPKMLFVVNGVLPMGVGKIASQVAHAAVLLYDQLIEDPRFTSAFMAWRQGGYVPIHRLYDFSTLLVFPLPLVRPISKFRRTTPCKESFC